MNEAVTVSTRVLEAVVSTAQDTDKTFNLNNPRTNLTLSDVQTAFDYLFTANDSDCAVFCSRDGVPYNKLKRAALVETMKRTTYLE